MRTSGRSMRLCQSYIADSSTLVSFQRNLRGYGRSGAPFRGYGRFRQKESCSCNSLHPVVPRDQLAPSRSRPCEEVIGGLRPPHHLHCSRLRISADPVSGSSPYIYANSLRPVCKWECSAVQFNVKPQAQCQIKSSLFPRNVPSSIQIS